MFVAHEDAVPRESVAQAEAELTRVGIGGVVALPSPTWPALFRPQHHSWPPERMPQVW